MRNKGAYRVSLVNGPKGIRTLDLFNAIEALSQLSYRPEVTSILARLLAHVNTSITEKMNFEYRGIHISHEVFTGLLGYSAVICMSAASTSARMSNGRLP